MSQCPPSLLDTVFLYPTTITSIIAYKIEDLVFTTKNNNLKKMLIVFKIITIQPSGQWQNQGS